MDGDVERSACSDCGYWHYVNPLPGVTVLVEDAHRVLLVKRREDSHVGGGAWCLPGGAIEYEEDFLTTGIRETKEESGIDIAVTSLISAVSNHFDNGLSTIVIVLLGRPIGGALKPDSSETTDVAWFAPDSLPEMAFEGDTHIIARYFQTPFAGAPIDHRFLSTGASS